MFESVAALPWPVRPFLGASPPPEALIPSIPVGIEVSLCPFFFYVLFLPFLSWCRCLENVDRWRWSGIRTFALLDFRHGSYVVLGVLNGGLGVR